jgi:biotin operon repressor
MSMTSVAYVRDHAKLSGPAHHLLLLLASYQHRQTDWAWPSVPRLARTLGVTRQRVQQLLKELREQHYVLIEYGGGRRTNRYRVLRQPAQSLDRAACPGVKGLLARFAALMRGPEAGDPRMISSGQRPSLASETAGTCQKESTTLEGGTILRDAKSIWPQPPNAVAVTPQKYTSFRPERGSEREKKDARARENVPKKCANDGCNAPQCPHRQQCAYHACCDACASGPHQGAQEVPHVPTPEA